jgi:hypothetical protein
MSFYTIVIIIAVCVLILCLVAVGLLMQRYNANVKFPPTQNPCPDGWMENGGNCVINGNVNTGFISNNVSSFVKNTHGIWTNQPSGGNIITKPLDGYTSVNFNDSKWNKGGSSVCSQKKWANQYGIAWDGVSNNNGC